jgi:hypothetical protein
MWLPLTIPPLASCAPVNPFPEAAAEAVPATRINKTTIPAAVASAHDFFIAIVPLSDSERSILRNKSFLVLKRRLMMT